MADIRKAIQLSLLAVIVASCAASGGSGAVAVVEVDGIPVSRSAYQNYLGTFTDPSGVRHVEGAVVLESLVNQVLVQREADRRGIRVREDEIAAGVAQWKELGLPLSALDRSGGLDALRERVRMFLLFKAVRAALIDVELDEAAIRAEYDRHDALAEVPFHEVEASIRQRLEETLVQQEWEAWLSYRRACASVQLLDDEIPYSHPSRPPSCAND